MKVLTLDTEALTEHCRRLEIAVRADFVPDVVVGIARGGAVVSSLMFDGLPHLEARCQRPSTANKDAARPWVWKLVRSMPIFIRDWLRVAEVRWLSRNAACHRQPVVDIAQPLPDGVCKVLVVDDAVDSGATLSAVVKALSREGLEVRTAAITVTRKDACIKPDYCIYDDETLIRFPWSKDVRQK